jgi:sirohydrochlorin ferrochelatase
MRPARLSLGVVLVAHGSRDPRAAVATEALARAVGRAHPSWAVHASYLDHAGPRPIDVLSSLPVGRAVVVPLLLTSAYHGRVDIPAVLSDAASLPLSLSLAPVLGPPTPVSSLAVSPLAVSSLPVSPLPVSPLPVSPLAVSPLLVSPLLVSPLLVEGLVRRLPVADLDAVVLAAAGTRDAAARSAVDDVANALSARLRLPCTAAYASAASPTPGEAVERLTAAGARRVGLAAYFLAPGLLYDNAVRSARAAGAVAVAEPLRDAPELVRLVAARVATAVPNALAPAA